MCRLTEELIMEILTFLPIKSLLQCKCVCKSWYSLISSAEFAKWHLKRVEKEENISLCSRLLIPCSPTAKCVDFEAASNQGATSTDSDVAFCADVVTRLYYPGEILPDDRTYVQILGSCNGLVCLSNNKNSVVLWNPTTRVSKVLPKHNIPGCFRKILMREVLPGTEASFSGLGYDKSTDDYKLIVGYKDHANADRFVAAKSIEILTLKSNRWQKFESQEGVTIANAGIYLDQFIHWIGWRKSHNRTKCEIVSFNVAEENFRNVLPFSEELSKKVPLKLSLGLSRNRLCLFFGRIDNAFEVWAVEGLGTNATWTNLSVIDEFYDMPLAVTNNGDMVFHYPSAMFCPASVGLYYRLEDKMLHEDYCCVCDPVIYLQTLVSPQY